MNKFLNKSNIVAIIVFVVLFGYIGVSYYLISKEKKIYVIGMCAKEQYPSRYKDILNADHVKEVLKKDSRYYRLFQNCEAIYNKTPKAMELKYK